MALDYILPSAEFETNEEGEVFRLEKRCKLKGKDFDVTLSGLTGSDFKLNSLGVRPQAVPLYAFTPDELPADTRIIHPDLSPSEADRKANDLHSNNIRLYNRARVICSAMIGEKISLIYFPVWALSYRSGGDLYTILIDSLAKRGYMRVAGRFDYSAKIKADTYSAFVKPGKHQCPNCGSDLAEHHFSLFYPCHNCLRGFMLESSGYKQMKTLCSNYKVGMPYWRFPLEFSINRPYKTVADFNKLLTAELALLRKEKRENSFYLYSPAFKATDVELWVKRAIGTLLTQPHDQLEEKLPGDGPVFTIDEAEAKQMALFLWRSATVKYARLSRDEFAIDDSKLPAGELVWLPIDDFNLAARSAEFKEVDINH